MNQASGAAVGQPQTTERNTYGLLGKLRTALGKRQTQRMVVNLIAILGVSLFVHHKTGYFYTMRNMQALSVTICVMTIIAFAETMVMIAGCIDISVGGIVVMTGIVATYASQTGMPLVMAFALAVVAGAAIGFFNSVLVIWVGITSMIATIATMFMCQGVANVITSGMPVTTSAKGFTTLGTGFPFTGVSYSLIVVLILLVIFVLIQRYSVLGAHAVAVGSDDHAAFLAGVNVKRTIILCFMLCGAASGFGGVMYVSRIGTAMPAIDQNLLFQVIVACVVGGTSLTGGEGSVFGTFVGAILIGTVNNGLNLLGISTFWQFIALGVILIGAVGLDVALRQDAFFVIRKRFFTLTRSKRYSPVEPTANQESK